MFDQLLLVNPKAIPYRLQKIQSFRARANLYRFLKNEDKAKEDETLAFTLLGEVSRDNASLDWVTGFEAMQQSIAWVREIRLGNLDNIESTAEKFLQTAKPSIKADVKYNVACAFALASSLSSEKKEDCALRAIAILNELVAADYFKEKERFENLRRDTDLQSLHERADFRAFVKSIGK